MGLLTPLSDSSKDSLSYILDLIENQKKNI